MDPAREEAEPVTIPLVVGVDGSESSLEAVDWAAVEAVRHGGAAPPLARSPGKFNDTPGQAPPEGRWTSSAR